MQRLPVRLVVPRASREMPAVSRRIPAAHPATYKPEAGSLAEFLGDAARCWSPPLSSDGDIPIEGA